MLKTFEKLPQKKQTAILDAAAHVFATRGYYRANVREICQKARISNGALYKYFRNKEDVFLTTIRRTIDLISEGQARYLPVTTSIYEVISGMLEDVEAFARRHPDYIVIYLDLGSPSMKRFSTLVSDRIERPSRDFWVALVEEGKRRGEVDRSIRSEIAAYAIDNHVMLYMFSCVSLHYARRFSNYFARTGTRLSTRQRRRLVVQSIRKLLT